MPSVAAVVVAAGSGERLGAGTPKALVELAGLPLVAHSVLTLAAAPIVEHLVVVAPPGFEGRTVAVIEAAGVIAGAVVTGGETRQLSVRAGIAACTQDIVAVHDAARPLLDVELLDAVVAALTTEWDGVAPGLAVTDTVKRVAGERVIETLDRGALRTVQTPQAFWLAALRDAHERFAGTDSPDDLDLLQRAGRRVKIIPGDPRNLKITHPADLRIASALLALRDPAS